MAKETKVTVIISTFNRARLLSQALQSLVFQNVSKNEFRVLVVDNNSSDETKNVTFSFINKLDIKYIFEPKQGLSVARNRGALEADSEYLAYLDDDAIAKKDWVKKILLAIKVDSPTIFGGSIYPFYENKKPKWFKDSYESRVISLKKNTIREKDFLSGSNFIIKRNIFFDLGMFNENLGIKGNVLSLGEETALQQLAKNKNIPIRYYPDMSVLHLVPSNKQNIKYMLKRYLISVREGYFIFPRKSILIYLSMGFLNFLQMIILLMLFPFRNRKRFPCWQNYFIERFFHRLRYPFWSYLYLKNLLKTKNE